MAALSSPGDYYYQHKNDPVAAGTNTGDWAPGSGVVGKDPWTLGTENSPYLMAGKGQDPMDPSLINPAYVRDWGNPTIPGSTGLLGGRGKMSQEVAKDALGNPIIGGTGEPIMRDVGGGMFKWDQAGGPKPSYTAAGQQQMTQPFKAGGQRFGGLQDFLDFMQTSTPGEQTLKARLEGTPNPDATAAADGTRASLFDALAPYLAKDSLKSPTGATPFTNWDPSGLLALLRKGGMIR